MREALSGKLLNSRVEWVHGRMRVASAIAPNAEAARRAAGGQGSGAGPNQPKRNTP